MSGYTSINESEQKSYETNPADAAARDGSTDIILQAFNLESHRKNWWEILEKDVPDIAKSGFTSAWLPPPTNSFTPEGYHPQNLYSLNSAYGSEYVLRALLNRLKTHNVRAMADIVINHRVGTTQGHNGKYNRYDGIPLAWDEYAVTSCSGGKGNLSTGFNPEGFPFVDHTQLFVRKDISNWLRWLRILGFQDFRFHYARGYSAEYVKEYIESAKPIFSVGEYRDYLNYKNIYRSQEIHEGIEKWIDGTGGLSAAFDYTTKGFLHKAFEENDLSYLNAQGRPPGLIGLRRPSIKAVTFLDNHDSGEKSTTQGNWPFPADHIVKGYVYILTHPGIPSVLDYHFYDPKKPRIHDQILKLIDIRKRHCIHSRSSIKIIESEHDLYAAYIGDKIFMKVGRRDWCPSGTEWQVAADGEDYAIWEKQESGN